MPFSDTPAYDGEGQRVAQRTSTSGGATTTTSTIYYLLGGLEEVSSDGTTTTLTKYFSVPGLPTAVRVGTTLSYLASDGLGSVSEALDASGAVTAQQLYAPYGGGRYTSGVMPTSKGYTGQRQDAASARGNSLDLTAG